MQRDRKKVHNKILKFMHRINKLIMNDKYLGLNRFRLDMYCDNWTRFSDGSGGELFVIFKMTDNLTGNTAYFTADNYSYVIKINTYMNDFLIRCSSGSRGHIPSLNYAAYDVHEVVSYKGEKITKPFEEYIVAQYDYIGCYDK